MRARGGRWSLNVMETGRGIGGDLSNTHYTEEDLTPLTPPIEAMRKTVSLRERYASIGLAAVET